MCACKLLADPSRICSRIIPFHWVSQKRCGVRICVLSAYCVRDYLRMCVCKNVYVHVSYVHARTDMYVYMSYGHYSPLLHAGLLLWFRYGVATISRLLKIIGLSCKRVL